MNGLSVHQFIVDELRRRVLSGLQIGLLHPGDRLPTIRSLAAEFGVTPRVILAACSELEGEGVVQRRNRSGVYVAPPRNHITRVPADDSEWLTAFCHQAWSRGIPGPQIADYVRQSLHLIPTRAIVVECNADQRWSFSCELTEDFGLDSSSVALESIAHRGARCDASSQADLFVTTAEHAQPVRQLGSRLGVPVLVVMMCTNLLERMSRLARTEQVYFVTADERFARKLRRLLSTSPYARNFHAVALDSDNLNRIPATGPLYVSRLARERLAGSHLLARSMPLARVISAASAQELLAFVIERNAGARRGAPQPVQRAR